MAVVAAFGNGLGPGKPHRRSRRSDCRCPSQSWTTPVFYRSCLGVTNKKGTGGDLSDEPSVDASWYYRWSRDVGEGQALGERRIRSHELKPEGERRSPADYLAMDRVTHLVSTNRTTASTKADSTAILSSVMFPPPSTLNLQKVERLGSRQRERRSTRTAGSINSSPNAKTPTSASILSPFTGTTGKQSKNNPVVPASQTFRR